MHQPPPTPACRLPVLPSIAFDSASQSPQHRPCLLIPFLYESWLCSLFFPITDSLWWDHPCETLCTFGVARHGCIHACSRPNADFGFIHSLIDTFIAQASSGCWAWGGHHRGSEVMGSSLPMKVKKGWVHVQRRKSCYFGGEHRVEGGAPECRTSRGPTWDREVKAPSLGRHLEFFSRPGEETLRHSFLATMWHLGGDIPC